MAISGDFFTIEGLADIANEGYANLGQLRSQIFGHGASDLTILTDLIDKLIQLMSDFTEQEQTILQLLRASSVDEVNTRLANFYAKSGYESFVNFNMKTIMAEYEAAVDEEKENTRLEYQAIFQNLLNDACNNDIMGVVKKEGAKAAINRAIQELARLTKHGSGTGKGGGTYSIKLDKSVIEHKNGFEFLPELVTPMVRRRFEELKSRAAGEVDGISTEDMAKIQKITTIDTLQTKTTDTSFEMNLGATIGKLTKNISPTEASHLSPNKLKHINDSIREAILAQLAPEYRNTAKKIINQMLDKNVGNPTMFFASGSGAQLRGILGEIGAMHAIANLLGLDEPDQQIIQWVATNTSKGRQLSVDIVLKQLRNINVIYNDSLHDLGIQVKNVQDLTIDFVNVSYNTVAEKLGNSFDSFEDVLYADLFNVPYRKVGLDKYAISQHPNTHPFLQKYMNIDRRIDEISAELRLFLTTYAPDFLYMGLGTDFVSQLATLSKRMPSLGGNAMYLVNKKMFTASSILADLIITLNDIKIKLNTGGKTKDIFGLENSLPGGFGLDIYMHNSQKNTPAQTIVDYLNGGKVMNLNSQSVKLRSSYNFSGK